MKKLILFILLLFAISGAQAKPYFSNAIIFGDSLSDIGNFPQSAQPTVGKDHISQWHQHDEFYYVPISNLVNRFGYKVDLKALFSLDRSYPWPDINEDYLETPINRSNHSLAWPEFFVSDAYVDGITPTNRIISSATLESSSTLYADLLTSVDYAWASATTLDNCTRHKNYDPLSEKNCKEASILAARDAYIKDRSNDNYNNLIIPGMRRQVRSFLEDVGHQKVHVGPDTVYVFYVGGNDLIFDYARISDSPYSALKNIAYDSSENVYEAALQLIKGNYSPVTYKFHQLMPFE